jgi:hypothetical protein
MGMEATVLQAGFGLVVKGAKTKLYLYTPLCKQTQMPIL